jgi:hypothetical protein
MALTVAAVVGCGGPSAGETRAELRRWTSAVDDVCRTTRERIARRGGARDVRELESMAARASEDVRAAIERIRRVSISEKARDRVRPFLTELGKIEPQLSDMTRTTADGSLEEIGELGLRLADQTKLFQDRADAAGLRQCADTRQFDAVLDAFTAPVYATQVARLEVWFVRKLRPIVSRIPATPADVARQLRGASIVFDRTERRLNDLYVYRPNRAVDAADDLEFALSDYEEYLELIVRSLRGGRRVLTPKGVELFRREVARHEREVSNAIVELNKAVGAEPLSVPDLPPPVEPEEDPA